MAMIISMFSSFLYFPLYEHIFFFFFLQLILCVSSVACFGNNLGQLTQAEENSFMSLLRQA